MISDTLAEAIADIREYLTDMPEVYQGEMRGRIDAMLEQMESVRALLDRASALSAMEWFKGQVDRWVAELPAATPTTLRVVAIGWREEFDAGRLPHDRFLGHVLSVLLASTKTGLSDAELETLRDAVFHGAALTKDEIEMLMKRSGDAAP